MVKFVNELGEKFGDNEFLGEIEKRKSTWEKTVTVGKVPKTKSDIEMSVCLMYVNGVSILLLMMSYSENKNMENEFGKFMRESRMLEIIELDVVDCNGKEFNEQLQKLANPPRIEPIIGQTLMELLEESEGLRHFLCYEIESVQKVKMTLNKITTAIYQTILENEFPEVLRIDMMVSTTLFERICQLLLNRSDSEQFKRTKLVMLTAIMIREIRMLVKRLSQQPRRSSACDALVAKANAAKRDTFRHFGSPVQLCVMIKITKFALTFNAENCGALTEKVLKKLQTNKCEEREKRTEVLEEFNREHFGKMFTSLLMDFSEVNALKQLLKHPGAKTRLFQLVGSAELFEKLWEKFGLTREEFTDSALINDDLLWDHYVNVLCEIEEDLILVVSHKIGADLAVFMRWVGQKLTVEQKKNAIFDRINAEAEDIYDQIFDMDETKMKDIEKYFREMFWGMKKVIEQMEGQIGQKTADEFDKLMRVEFEKQGTESDDETEESFRWICELHGTEFGKLLENGKFEKKSRAQENLEENAVENLSENSMKNKNTWMENKTPRKIGLQAENGVIQSYMHIQCPAKSIPLEELQKMDRNLLTDLEIGLKEQYLQLFWEDIGKKSELKRNELAKSVEIGATLLYYRSQAEELLKHAQIYAENDKKMAKFVNIYFAEFMLLDGQNLEEKLCKNYEFIHKLVNDAKLIEMSEEWTKLLALNVKKGTEWATYRTEGQIAKGKIILLGENETQWHKIGCAVQQNAKHFALFVRQCSSFVEGVHLFALVRLIETSKEMQSIFCHGSQLDILRMKHQIFSKISHEALDMLEMLFPEVMHYEQILPKHESQLLMSQLEFKSGTTEAESAEARCSSAKLLFEIKKVEKNLYENAQKFFNTPLISEEEFSEMIQKSKKNFYFLLHLAATNEQKMLLRNALYQLRVLKTMLNNIWERTLSLKMKENFKDWYAKEWGDKEESTKSVMKLNRIFFRKQIRELFSENDEVFAEFREKATIVPGAKTRFCKLFLDDVSIINEAEMSANNWMIKEIWNDDKNTADELFDNESRLYSLYIEFLTIADSMNWLNVKLKLDLFIFVQWTNAKIANSAASIARQKCANVWRRHKFLFYQMYDRWHDEPMDEMPNFQIYQSIFLNEINLLFEKILQGKQMKSEKVMKEEIRKINEKAQKKYDEKKATRKDKKGENYAKFEVKLDEKNVETLSKLVEENANLKKTLKYIYESFVDVNDMPEYLGKETTEKIWKTLAIKYFEKEEKEEEKEAKLNAKKKKQKRKKSKNGDKETKQNEIKSDNEKNSRETEKEETAFLTAEEEGEESFAMGRETERKEQMKIITVTKSTVEEGKGGNGKGKEEKGTEPPNERLMGNEEDKGQKEGTKLINFANDQFLALKYAEIVNASAKEQRNDGIKMPKAIELANVGTLANEIANRLEAIESLGDQRKSDKTKSISDQWERFKEMKYSAKHSYEGISRRLFQLLMELSEEMDNLGTNLKDKSDKWDQENEHIKWENWRKIMGKLHFRKFGIAIVKERIENWEKLCQKQKTLALSNIIEKRENILEEFERNLEQIEKAEKQRKLEKWQEINSIKELEKENLEEKEKEKRDGKSSDYGHKNGIETLIVLRRIFNEWSDAAQFQFPSRFFMKHLENKFETICILPDGFDHGLIFGISADCDGNGAGGKCADNSLHCALCQNLELNFLQKFPKNNFSSVPSMRIGLQNVQIDVKFVQIAQFAHIPRKNFSAKQLEIFLIKLGQNIHKLEENYHFDERAHRYEICKRKELRKKNFEEKEANEYDAEELRQFDKITQFLYENQKKASEQIQKIKERKEEIFVISAHAANLKVLQFLLNENDYLLIVNKFELSNGIAIKTLEKFRKIYDYLEKWAKNNDIFCESLGYLSEHILLQMLTKVFLLFPNSSMPFLINKFFLIFSKWKWPMPVQLTPIDHKIVGTFLSWSPFGDWIGRRDLAWEKARRKHRTKKEQQIEIEKTMKSIRKELAMAVIMPTIGGRNLAVKVNISSAKVVQNELKKAWDKLWNKLETKDEAIKFTEKYENFIVVECKGPSHNVDKFCDFVGKRLRYELLEFVENPLAIWVDFCHVRSKMIGPTECPSADLEQIGNSIGLRHWLVGIQMAAEQKANSAFKRKLRDNLRKKLDVKIKEDFEKGSFHNVQLNSEFAERENLQKWHFHTQI
ncbi:hypothetical protein niasHS_003202 [Heterodera schachtii]|uniref:polynucleotide adenylyltransferase n=1 Tax=Heterodera schachtii TaxID=97005 RepID=A0ABD2KFT8_HETSC